MAYCHRQRLSYIIYCEQLVKSEREEKNEMGKLIPAALRVTPEMFEKCKKNASKLGLNFSAYVRMIICNELEKDENKKKASRKIS